ncbi:MAG TPA: hypothetical protein VN923_15270 [Thermoanaerobaculia bacterium]|nr:hypothetical protein [Thermoanaerobaculia bacterium]
MRAAGSAVRTLALVLGLVIASTPAARAQTGAWLDLVGRAASTNAAASWLDGGTGRLVAGDGEEGWQGGAIGEAQLGADWRATPRLALHLHARARAQGDAGGRPVGIVEAWAALLAMPLEGVSQARVRGGAFILPTSRENLEPLWTSPYTFTLSAVNTWIGEEVRPLGVLAEYEHDPGERHGFRTGFSLFGGNDTAGALLAWRGWAMGDRLSTIGEALPLPALPSLESGGPFERQDRDGTTPFGADLDGRPGWAGYTRYRYGGLARVLLTHYDNCGDRELHHGEYAWHTDFDQLGVELFPATGWTVAGEHLRGRTRMGVPSPRADADFAATYVLLSWQRESVRSTVRWDRFSTDDRDRLPAGERSDEDGHAWTAAVMWQARPELWLGVEYLDVDVERPALAGPGSRADGGRSVTVGLRYRIGTAQ